MILIHEVSNTFKLGLIVKWRGKNFRVGTGVVLLNEFFERFKVIGRQRLEGSSSHRSHKDKWSDECVYSICI